MVSKVVPYTDRPTNLDAQDSKITVHDIHATVLQTLGVDHTKLTYRHQGRDFRLTDVGGKVIDEIIL